MTKNAKVEEKLNYLLKLRKSYVKRGVGAAVLEINEKIAKLAQRLKIDYYSLN